MASSLQLLHTADVHLGLKFARYPESVAQKLRDARYETLQSLVDRANTEGCDLFTVGGDLFDTVRVSAKDVQRGAEILARFEGRGVLVLPGNHDYVTDQPDDLWKIFEARADALASGRIKVLRTPAETRLDDWGLPVSVFSAPCRSKHSKTHGLDWIQAQAHTPSESGRIRIGLAHGSLEGLACDLEGQYFPMKREDLLACGLDLWLMGHIHVPAPIRPGAADKIFYPGTPEPDGFDCAHGGHAWRLNVSYADRGVQALSIPSGRFRFVHAARTLTGAEDFSALRREWLETPRPNELVKLKLEGTLPHELLTEVGGFFAALKENTLHAEDHASTLRAHVTAQDLDRAFVSGSFPHRLLTRLAAKPDASAALSTAWELIEELRK